MINEIGSQVSLPRSVKLCQLTYKARERERETNGRVHKDASYYGRGTMEASGQQSPFEPESTPDARGELREGDE